MTKSWFKKDKFIIALSLLFVSVICTVGMLGGYVRHISSQIITTKISNTASPTGITDDENINRIIQRTANGNGTYAYVYTFIEYDGFRFPWEKNKVNYTLHETKYNVILQEGDFFLNNPIVLANTENFTLVGVGYGRAVLQQLNPYADGIYVTNTSGNTFANLTITGGYSGIHFQDNKLK